jgi:hypothetical protein
MLLETVDDVEQKILLVKKTASGNAASADTRSLNAIVEAIVAAVHSR